jgi:hypothetical protein
MDAFIGTIVGLIQLMLTGFVIWGGWLVFRESIRGPRAEAAATQPSPAQAPADDFERVASLVLLALLCTTMMAAL